LIHIRIGAMSLALFTFHFNIVLLSSRQSLR
jgi:hypothetical protein